MTALLGLVVAVLAVIGAIRVTLAVYRTSRRALASFGRLLARLEPARPLPSSGPTEAKEQATAREVSTADIAAMLAARDGARGRGRARKEQAS